jgi:uncharacterized protein (DUF1810 family)
VPEDDPFALGRFVAAQDAGGTYDAALAEVRAGRKRSHWMWFVFPQLAGLGRSSMAQRYAISSLDEARAYLRHPVLGPRLREVAHAAASIAGGTAEDVFGGIDAVKLRSSMTLFVAASHGDGEGGDGAVFTAVLDRYFDGRSDPATDALLDR